MQMKKESKALGSVHTESVNDMASQKVLVMVAMEEEAQYLKPYLENPEDLKLRGIPVSAMRGTIKGVQVDIVVSGIGAVYAASATSAALLQTSPDCVISCGCSCAAAAAHPAALFLPPAAFCEARF